MHQHYRQRQVNIVDAESTLTINELLELEGIQECSWDFEGSPDFGVSATQGSFTIDDGSYYLENNRDGFTYFARYYSDVEFFSWNTEAPQPIGMQIKIGKYEMSVNNPIGHRAIFKMLDNVDYGITCQEVDSVILPLLPGEIRFIQS